MTLFILKSTLSMAVLLALYHLLLEKEKMHRFNRFYLLGTLVLSFAIPFIQVPVYVEVVAAHINTFEALPTDQVVSAQEPATHYWIYLICSIYAVVTMLLIVRFSHNILRFRSKIINNTKFYYKGANLVLLNEQMLPHTFLNYIFISKQEFENNQIEKELYTHELAHVYQKHTLDILFIEALKSVMWFNPLIYLYKKAIQLNHEFLADQAVVETTQDIFKYQSLLLNKANIDNTICLASSLNFSLTKKRFTMMTKYTSKTKKTIFQTLVLPVICGLIGLLCTETIAQQTPITVDFNKVGEIEVFTPTQEEIDSIREVDPEKYKEEPKTRIMRTDYTVTESGKKQVVTTYDKQHDYKATLSQKTMNGIAGIDPKKIKNININSVTEAQMDSLKAAEPEYYKDAQAADYKSITIIYQDNTAKEVKKTYYENHRPLNSKVTIGQQDRLPQFSEGNFHEFVLKSLNLSAIKKNLSARVYVSFMVETDGSVSNVKIVRDSGSGLGEDIKKAVEKSPKWEPGIKNGKLHRMSYTLPIIINITN